MVYVLLALAHIEAVSGIAALAGVAGVLIFFGHNRQARYRRVLAALGGVVTYMALWLTGIHADVYVHWLENAAVFRSKLVLVLAPGIAGIALTWVIINASRGDRARVFAVAASSFMLAVFVHAYGCIWLDGFIDRLLFVLPFVTVTGASVLTAFTLLYRPSE